VGPSNAHELEIVLAVDRMAFEGKLSPSAADQIKDAVRFIMSKDDTEFLVKYILWRIENPIAKRDSGSV
jgi:hypothetical protein